MVQTVQADDPGDSNSVTATVVEHAGTDEDYREPWLVALFQVGIATPLPHLGSTEGHLGAEGHLGGAHSDMHMHTGSLHTEQPSAPLRQSESYGDGSHEPLSMYSVLQRLLAVNRLTPLPSVLDPARLHRELLQQ